MKKYIYLTKKYIKSYPKRCAGLVLCISLFVFAFLTILWYNDSYRFSVEESSRTENGYYSSISFYVNPEFISDNKEQLLNEGSGIVEGLYRLDGSDNIWLGTIDENASKLIPLQLLSGEFPKNSNEIAIEKSAYDALGLSQEIGNTVELTVQNADGGTEKKSYTLTGIVKSFSRKLISLNYNIEDLSIPSVFTVNDGGIAPSYFHVFAKENTYLSRNIESEYYYVGRGDYYVSQKTNITNMTLIPIALFFVLATVMGVFSISAYFFKEQEAYLNALRCIGFSKKKSKRLMALQGFLLWLSSLITAVAMALIVMLIMKVISSFSSLTLIIHPGITAFILAALLDGGIIFISFAIQLMRFYRRPPLREAIYMPKKPRKSITNLKRCWHKAYGRRYRLQNATCILLVFFCVGMSAFGAFLPLFNARGTTFSNPDDFPDDTNYALHMRGGSSSEESFYINFPIGCGVSREAVEKIINDDRVKVTEAMVENLCVPFFLSDKTPEQPMLHKYVIEEERPGISYRLKHDRAEEMIELAGGDSGTDCLVQLPVIWHSYDSLTYNIKEFTDGGLSEENYKNGIEIAAPANLCSVGDEFTMVIPVPDSEATEQNINEHIKFEVANVRVAATYDESKIDEPRLFISTEYLFSIYPDVNYETVLLQNLEPDDKSWTEELEDELEYVEAVSNGVVFDNYAKMAKEFYDEVNLQTLQIVISVIIFVVIIMIAIICSSYVQVRSNLTSYAIMRAIGARVETIEKLVFNEINHILIKGIVPGAICGWGINIFFAQMAWNIKTWDIFLFYVAPLFIVTVLLLYFGSRFAVKRAVHSLINKDIIEKINEIE